MVVPNLLKNKTLKSMKFFILEFERFKKSNLYQRKIGFFIVIFFGLISTLSAQEISILFNKTTFSLFNPSFSGVDGRMLSFNSRSQWTGVELSLIHI